VRGGQADVLMPGIVIGAGMGGFLDGIVLHQILQWHNMLSGWIPPDDVVSIKVNMVWDGWFHAAVWLMTAVGLGLLWRAVARHGAIWSGRRFLGATLLGWGLFNLVEGLVNHQVLGLHHVNQYSEHVLAWDVAFLASGVVLIGIGAGLARRPKVVVTIERSRVGR
jgi:uncharacterized membrane protein